MGLLEKLWDDTIAGPRPDSGLGRLRKCDTSNFRSYFDKGTDGDVGNGRSYGEEATGGMRVTRSIMIVKPPGSGSAPPSPAGSITPSSPFSPGDGSRSGAFRFRRRSLSDAYEKPTNEAGVRTPPPPPQDV